MTFWAWIILALVAGFAIGMIVAAFMATARGNDEIIADLVGALQEWVDINENYWNAPDFRKKRYERSCKALNRARGM